MTRAVPLGIFFTLIVAFAAYLPAQTSAQMGLGGIGADLTLSISPAYPSPGGTVHVEARSTLMDLDAFDISWYENGKKVGGGPGIKEIDVIAGGLGSETIVEAVISEGGLEDAAAQARIAPTEVDLMWESDSYVPPFYRGRALASADTSLHLQAIPRFRRADGSFVSMNEIIFTWRRGESIILSASGRGRSTASIESPGLFGSDLISVEARTPDGRFSGAASARITSTEPRLLLYEDRPLFGILYHQALGIQNFISGAEMSFAAVPYFAEAVGPDDSRLVYAWRVNGRGVASVPARPGEITINATGSSGNALIELALSHATNFFMSSFGRWGVTFSETGGGADPFGGSTQ